MLARCYDAGFVNQVVNHPDVRLGVGAPELGELDLTELIDRPEHWFLMGDYGGFMLSWSAPDVREVHTFITPEGRGKWANAARAAMINYARKNGTKMLWTKIDPNDRHVERYARQGGMQLTDEVIETFGKPYRIYRMELN
jgi:hypothetical protein